MVLKVGARVGIDVCSVDGDSVVTKEKHSVGQNTPQIVLVARHVDSLNALK